MLKNRTALPVEVRYNGIDILVAGDEFLDVMDFKITADQITPVELHIRKGYPNIFETIERPAANISSKEADKKILDLQSELEESKKKAAELGIECERLTKKCNELNDDNHALEGKIDGLKTQIGELKAKLKAKDMPDKK
jgi:peptidoglycan hydrolase CwlO-like protein